MVETVISGQAGKAQKLGISGEAEFLHWRPGWMHRHPKCDIIFE
jgi:hypothetical protein